jgi:MFS family permease
MAFVVISWLALAAGGPRAVGAVMFVGGAVTALTAPVLGYLLDTAGLRWLMAADNAVRCGLMIGLAVLARSGHVTACTLMAFMAVSAALTIVLAARGLAIQAGQESRSTGHRAGPSMTVMASAIPARQMGPTRLRSNHDHLSHRGN